MRPFNCITGTLSESTMLRLFVALIVAVYSVSAGIYPDDHWSFSKKLTLENFDETVKNEVDAGNTLFVRWIASEG